MGLMQKLTKFGSMVIGAERAAMQKQIVQSRVTKFGPMVLGTKAIPGTNTPAADSVPVPGASLNIPKTQELLRANPELTVIYLEAELRRGGDGPRRSLLDWCLEEVRLGRLKLVGPDQTTIVDRVKDHLAKPTPELTWKPGGKEKAE